MADEQTNRQAFRIQECYCTAMAAPITARVCAALAEGLTRESRTGARVLDWPGQPTADALPLRLVGGLHALDLADVDAALSAVFDGSVSDPDAVRAVLARVLVEHDAALLPWLDGPPQTNEPMRSGALMVGLAEAARRYRQPLEVLEIGSSAGLNLLIDRFAFDLGGTCYGAAGSSITIAPEWRGNPPPPADVRFAGVRGVDIRPIDATDPAAQARLRAYVWADNPARLARLDRAFAMLAERPVRPEQGDAADWVEARLAEPQAPGTTRVLMHSVVWQYLPPDGARRIEAAMACAGVAATAERPLAWVMMEPDRVQNRQEVRLKSWPGDYPMRLVATAQAHGAWVKPEDEVLAEEIPQAYRD